MIAADHELMERAVARAAHARLVSPPNPWVGCVVVAADGTSWEGATERPGSRHAERVALDAAGDRAAGATLVTTLEPCDHTGRTGPCTEAIIAAGVARVVVGVLDPDPNVSGRGVKRLRAAGIEVVTDVATDLVEAQLEAYLHHRRTGRPWVVAKMAATLDGRTAAADGTSQWITGEVARADVHRLRAESDAILVGAGTVRADDPRLTVRGVMAADGSEPRQPRRIVLGSAPEGAAIHPCTEFSGDPDDLIVRLGEEGIVQLMVEGGASVLGDLHRRDLIDHVVIYLAPMLMGGDDGTPVVAGPGAPTIDAARRGELVDIRRVGDDVRLDLRPDRPPREGSP